MVTNNTISRINGKRGANYPNSYINIIVTPILNISRKFSMCIIFSTGYIKIYNVNYFE